MTQTGSRAGDKRLDRVGAATRRQPVAQLLGVQHMAYVRWWAEGLDLVAGWNRYLYVAGPGDGRRARGELQRLLDQLRGLALAHGRRDIAVLLRRDPDAIIERGPAVPTLEEFRERQPEDFYGEAELLELYEAEIAQMGGISTSLRRRQRLRERIINAVQWLARVGARTPEPGHPVAAWLDSRVAQRLLAAGVVQLSDLMARIATKGFHWHRGVPKLGAGGAARIVRWLREHEETLGTLPAPSLAPLSTLVPADLTPAPCTGIVPFERFAIPLSRDGGNGTNRAHPGRCKIAAANDYEAIAAWLRLRPGNSHTWRAYRKEAERFLLWSVLERGKPLSSLDGIDCAAYRDHLAAPGAAWCGPRHVPRWSPNWRPFEGPLTPRSQLAAITIVRSLCEWLVRRHYLDSNPWDDVPARADAPSMPQLRALSQRQWDLVQDWLCEQERAEAEAQESAVAVGLDTPYPTLPCPALPYPAPPSSARHSAALARLKFLLNFTYMTGLRLSELAAARLTWLRHEPLDDGEMVWSIMVLGKRSKWREVPLPGAAVQALREYLQARGLSSDLERWVGAGEVASGASRGSVEGGPSGVAPYPALLDSPVSALPTDTPLVAHLSGPSPLSDARIYEILVDAFERCALALESSEPRAALRIRKASTHWLRHTYGSHAAARNVPQDVLQANLGHESLATTSIYVRAEKGRRHRAVQEAFGEG